MSERRSPRSSGGPTRTGAASRRPARPGTPPSRTGSDRTRSRTAAPRPSSTRTTTTTRSSVGSPDSPRSPVSPVAPEPAQRLRQGLTVTRRAVAVLVVMAVLVLSYASSLRVYLTQQADAAEARAEIAAAQQRIAGLEDRLQRWEDPAYVTVQARERLGWVVPGETGYVVLGADGRPVEGAEIDSARSDGAQPDADAWWARLAGSLEAADHPAPPPDDAVLGEQPDEDDQPR